MIGSIPVVSKVFAVRAKGRILSNGPGHTISRTVISWISSLPTYMMSITVPLLVAMLLRFGPISIRYFVNVCRTRFLACAAGLARV